MKTARELPRTPLAMAVMNLLMEHPMHPYEMKLKIKERGHDQVIRLKGGSIYDTVVRLEEGGFIKSQETSREGRRPERTVYAITDTGREEIKDWLRELLSEPVHEYPQFAAALAFMAGLSKEDVVHLLQVRIVALEARIAALDSQLKSLVTDMRLPRLFMIEGEYSLAMDRAELAWVRQTIQEIQEGQLWITHEQMKAFEQGITRQSTD